MARTNPCQMCEQVPAAEFTLAAAYPQASWFPQLVVNICEGCLLNAAYQRVEQLAELAAREQGMIGQPALETIEAIEDLDAVGAEPVAPHPPKSRRPAKAEEPEEVPAAAPAAAD